MSAGVPWSHPLLRAEGSALLSAHQAILKGAVQGRAIVTVGGG